MKNKLLSDTSLLFLASIIAFIFVPLFMIGNSPEDYNFIDMEVFFKSAVSYSIIFWLVLILINSALYLLKLRKTATLFSYFILSWIVISGFILSVSESTTMIDPEKNPVALFNLIIVFILSLIFSAISLTAFNKYMQMFLLVVVITSTFTALVSIYDSDSMPDAENHPSLLLSNKKNIFVIGFDGMAGEMVADVIKKNADYSDELKDFTIFENAVTQAPDTATSLMGDIYGVHDYKSKGNDIASVRNELEDEGLNNKITARHIADSFAYGYRGGQIEKIKINTAEVRIQQKHDTFDFFRYPIIRMWTSVGLNAIGWKSNIVPLKKHIIETNESLEIVEKLQNHKGQKWVKKMIISINLFDSFVSNITTSDKDFSLRYLHFTFTHSPVNFDAKCNYRSDDELWFKDNQNEKGIRNQDICAIGKFIGFIHKLKALGVYDNSLIVFKSDHGKPTTFFSKSPNNIRINNNRWWGYGRYRPMLMMKDFGSNNIKPVFKSDLVLLNDIAKTLCEKSNVTKSCESFPGVNLLGESLESDESYFIYVPKNKRFSSKFKDYVSVKIPSRKVSLLQAMENSSLIKLSVHDVTKDEPNFSMRLSDLTKIKTAIIQYHDINKKYPKSAGFDGACTKWGKSSADYIKGLVPIFMKTLPVDPRGNIECGDGYLYKSNGEDYKLIVHAAPKYDLKNVDKKLIDPTRSGWAYGVWSDGAKNW